MNRFERKFVITHKEYHMIAPTIKHLSLVDSHARNKSRYPVFTRYFDTPDRTFVQQKVEGEFEHVKIRMRSYSSRWHNHGPYFLEAKLKEKDCQHKVRIKISDLNDYSQNPEYLKIQNVIYDRALEPSCNIYYEREAYELNSENLKIRINFDHNICALFPEELSMTPHLLNERQLDHGEHILMEIKCSNIEFPNSLSQILGLLDTKIISFSKYVWGYEFLNEISLT